MVLMPFLTDRWKSEIDAAIIFEEVTVVQRLNIFTLLIWLIILSSLTYDYDIWYIPFKASKSKLLELSMLKKRVWPFGTFEIPVLFSSLLS
ncbi:hypothetical protein VNO78_20563 [Psophocarpus tetragonolobus]|uniref:Uncharacterized protein n=1 Tax=Psophocarpus tetragonolobus TaxID=3891 RepID=A0AAN9SDL4_PSOTE